MKKLFLSLMLTLLLSSAAFAADVVKIIVTGDNVNLRSAPSTRGKVYTQAYSGDQFLAEAAVVQDKNDKWYKILFYISEMEGQIFQTNKTSIYENSSPYINARFVRPEAISEYEQQQIDYLERGRPVSVRVGDDMSDYLNSYESPHTSKAPMTLLTEPNAGARKTTYPAGTVILYNDASEWNGHYDVDDNLWIYVIGQNKKLLGWIKVDDWPTLSLD